MKYKLKGTAKVRIILDSVSFYSTVKQMRDGVGDSMSQNASIKEALHKMEEDIKRYGKVFGIGGKYGFTEKQHDVQISLL